VLFWELRDTVINFKDNFEKQRVRGNPRILVEFHLELLYQFSEAIIKCVWLQIAGMKMVAT